MLILSGRPASSVRVLICGPEKLSSLLGIVCMRRLTVGLIREREREREGGGEVEKEKPNTLILLVQIMIKPKNKASDCIFTLIAI